jgi:ankyrin repeat protein
MSSSREIKLWTAARAGKVGDVKRQLSLGRVDINWANPAWNKETPLCSASINGHAQVVALLIQHGADVNKANSDGRMPLYLASEGGFCETATMLLLHGADVKKAEVVDGPPLSTPLQWAAYHGHASLVALLLENGGDDIEWRRNRRNFTDECIPLVIAAKRHYHEVVKVILQYYVDFHEQMQYSGRNNLGLRPYEYMFHNGVSDYRNSAAAPGLTEGRQLATEVITRSRILCLLHVLFETFIVNLTDDEATSMLVEMLTLEEI